MTEKSESKPYYMQTAEYAVNTTAPSDTGGSSSKRAVVMGYLVEYNEMPTVERPKSKKKGILTRLRERLGRRGGRQSKQGNAQKAPVKQQSQPRPAEKKPAAQSTQSKPKPRPTPPPGPSWADRLLEAAEFYRQLGGGGWGWSPADMARLLDMDLPSFDFGFNLDIYNYEYDRIRRRPRRRGRR